MGKTYKYAVNCESEGEFRLYNDSREARRQAARYRNARRAPLVQEGEFTDCGSFFIQHGSCQELITE